LTLLDGRDVSEEIRSPEVSRAVSYVAMVPGVRRQMVRMQRALAAGGGIVMEGRDVGTVVLPGADCKFFLTASPKERTLRRYRELLAKGYQVELAELETEMTLRDRLDSERTTDPLVPADDAAIVDTTGRKVEEVVEDLLERCRGVSGRH
jgi:cytidylate kinase